MANEEQQAWHVEAVLSVSIKGAPKMVDWNDKYAKVLQKKWVVAVRWIGVIPAAILGGCVGWIVAQLIGQVWMGHALEELISHPEDLGEHVLAASLYWFVRLAIMHGLTAYAGIKMAPSHRKVVFFSMVGVWVLLLMIGLLGMGMSMERGELSGLEVVAIAVQELGKITGLACAGWVVAYGSESEEFKSGA